METKFNPKNTAVKRIMQEIKEMQAEASCDFIAEALDSDIFEWHFVIRGPPETEFEGGIYHGRILLPPDYPFKPPAFMMLTPSGRFETGVKICLSISSHHPEHWQPSWSVRTALTALIAFMPSPGNGALGSLDFPKEERVKMAARARKEPPTFGSSERQKVVDEMHQRMCARVEAAAAAAAAAAASAAAASPEPATAGAAAAAAASPPGSAPAPSPLPGPALPWAAAPAATTPAAAAAVASAGAPSTPTPAPATASPMVAPAAAPSPAPAPSPSPAGPSPTSPSPSPAAASSSTPAAAAATAASASRGAAYSPAPAAALAPQTVLIQQQQQQQQQQQAGSLTDHTLTLLAVTLSIGIASILLRKVMAKFGLEDLADMFN